MALDEVNPPVAAQPAPDPVDAPAGGNAPGATKPGDAGAAARQDASPAAPGGDMLKDFPSQAPGVYKWAVAAVGFVSAVMGIIASLNLANLALVGIATVFALLLIFVLFCFEKDDINTQWQSRVLSWFASAVLVFISAALISCIFFGWPRKISAAPRLEAARLIENIEAYDLRESSITRKVDDRRVWVEYYRNSDSPVRLFQERRFTSDYILLWDEDRKINIRIPTGGGLAQWTKMEQVERCTTEPCWQDIAPVDARLINAIWLNAK